MTLKLICSLALAALMTGTGPAMAQEVVAVMDIAPEVFVQTAAKANAFEIRSSELAVTKAQTPALRDFAEQMIADHTAAAEALQAAAEAPVADDLDPKHEGMLALLEGAEGGDFDMLYADMQAAAHPEAVTLFSTFVAPGDGGEVHAFAAETLPRLVEHKAHIDAIIGRGIRD